MVFSRWAIFDPNVGQFRFRFTNDSALRGIATASVRLRVERAGVPVTFSLVAVPGRHPASELLDAVFVVLAAIGFPEGEWITVPKLEIPPDEM